MEETDAIIFFTDIRGFTKWSEGTEAFQRMEKFVNQFYKIIRNLFHDSYIKNLGDGAMIITEIDIESDSIIAIEDLLVPVLKENLEKIKQIDEEFNKLCNEFSARYGYRTELRLGWGIARGVVKKVSNNHIEDYIGANINKCARLCQIARPYGIVIERDDFPKLPSETHYDFIDQIRKFDDIASEVNVWVTPEIATQYIPREKMKAAPEVHVAGTCIKRENDKISILIAKRNSDRSLFPGLYEGCGGQLAYSELFTDGVKRHFKVEMHVDVEVLESIHRIYRITEPNQPKIPGINFLCIYKDGKPESKHHSDVKWVSEDNFKQIPSEEFIPYLKEDILRFIDTFKKDRKKEKKVNPKKSKSH